MPVFKLTDELVFPHPKLAEDGLLAVGGDLRPERLLLAYSNGIFPWPEDEESPLLWASPDVRLVLVPQNLHVSKRLQRMIRQNKFSITFDAQFPEVIKRCAQVPRPGQYGTWITRDMIQAYIRLHELGFAHSVESYYAGELVGGIYGISLGGAFFGESMFYVMPNASRVALYHLVQRLQHWEFDFLDAQVRTAHMLQWGAHEITREEYLHLLKRSLQKSTRRGNWSEMS